MVSRLFLVYVVAELAAVVALAGSQLKAQLNRLRSGLAGGQSTLAADSMAVALGTLLVVVPGLLTSAAGLLLLLPPTRAAARPLLGAMAVRGLGRRVPLITVNGVGGYHRARQPDYIDGEVIDVSDVTEVVDPPALGPNSHTP